MTLQDQMKQKIDDYGGINHLTVEIERLRSKAKEKELFNNMIIYFNSLFTQEIDVVGYAIDYRQASLDTIAFLQKFNQIKKERTNEFLMDLIQFKLDYVANIRKIS